jgi:hypothetical protein
MRRDFHARAWKSPARIPFLRFFAEENQKNNNQKRTHMRLTKALIAAAAAISLGNAPVGLSAQITPPSEPYPIVASTSPDVSASANAPRDIVVNGVTYTVKPSAPKVTQPAHVVSAPKPNKNTPSEITVNGVTYTVKPVVPPPAPAPVPPNNGVVIINDVEYFPARPAPTPVSPTVVSPAFPTQGYHQRQESYTQRVPSGEENDAFFGFSGGLYKLDSKELDNLGTGDLDMWGVSFGGGFSFAPTEVGRIRFAFEAGFHFLGETYSGYIPGYPYSGYYNLDVDYFAVPVLITPAYEFNLGTPNARLRIGPVFGATVFHVEGELDFHGYYGDASDTCAVFTYGGNIGFSYTPADSFYFDISYRILKNTKGDMNFGLPLVSGKFQSTAHQFNFTIGWRF